MKETIGINIENQLNQIEKTIKKYSDRNAEWNINYFKFQKERYLKDINYFSKLDNVNNVLEIGAAPFHLSALLVQHNYNLKILDLDPSRFSDFLNEFNIHAEKCDIEHDVFPVEKSSIDLAIFTEVFEHLRINPVETLNKISETIRPGGYIYLTTPNFYRHYNLVNIIKGKGFVNAFREFNKLNTIGHMGHVREYTRGEVTEFLENSNFEIVDFEYKNASNHSRFSRDGIITNTFKGLSSHLLFLARKKV